MVYASSYYERILRIVVFLFLFVTELNNNRIDFFNDECKLYVAFFYLLL